MKAERCPRCGKIDCGIVGHGFPLPASEPWHERRKRFGKLFTTSEFLLCDETGAVANNRGVCPVHNGDACLWRYIKVAESDDRVVDAEMRLGSAWHGMALYTVENALVDPDEPELFSPFDIEVRAIIRGHVAEAVKEAWKEANITLKALRATTDREVAEAMRTAREDR